MNSRTSTLPALRRVTSAAIVALAAFAVSPHPTLSASAPPLPPVFKDIGALSAAGGFFSTASALSDDGQVVVGNAWANPNVDFHAFRWTSSGGLTFLPGPTGVTANDTGGDGFPILGNDNEDIVVWPNSSEHFYPDFGTELPPARLGLEISADGTVVLGVSEYYGGIDYFRWSASDGLTVLPFHPDGLSADGNVVIGRALSASRWTLAEGLIALGELPGANKSYAQDLSGNGSIIVGTSVTSFRGGGGHYVPCRWNTWPVGDGLLIHRVALGQPDGDVSLDGFADRISVDGTVVGGWASAGSDVRATIWDADHGTRWLQPLLEDDYGLGAELEGWTLRHIRGVATDENYLYLAGDGDDPAGLVHAWWVRVPKPGPDFAPGRFRVPLLFDREPYIIICDPAGPHGPVQFAVLGTRDFDPRTLVRSSIRFGNASAAMAPYTYRDVNRDGHMDLALQFNLPDVYRGLDWRNTKVLRFLGTTTAKVDVLGEVLVQPQLR